MPIIPAELVHAGGQPSAADLEASLLAGHTLLADSPDNLL